MNRYEAARALGVAAADVLDVDQVDDGVAVTVRDGGRRLIRPDGVYALDDHPTTRGLRPWARPAAAAAAAKDAPGREGMGFGNGEAVPSGSVDDVLKWVGEDTARAAAALAAEEQRDHPRSTLVSALRKLAD